MTYGAYSWGGSAYDNDRDPRISKGSPADLTAALAPMILRLGRFDELRLAVAAEGGNVAILEEMTEILSRPTKIESGPIKFEVALTEPNKVRTALSALHYDLHFEVRQPGTLLPVYYLCRARWDYWLEYGLVVEDLYVSPGYPGHDERVVKLMRFGHEVYYVCLGQFRARMAETMYGDRRGSRGTSQKIDGLLYRLGRRVFQAMWHEDQRPAIAASVVFHLDRFQQALELLYLCLTGSLCELRGAANAEFFRFFTDVYPQPAVCAFLKMLESVDGGVLASFPQKAFPLYRRLSTSFGSFLKKEVAWGDRKLNLPLYKILFGNFSHLDIVQNVLAGNEEVEKAARALEEVSGAVIGEIA